MAAGLLAEEGALVVLAAVHPAAADQAEAGSECFKKNKTELFIFFFPTPFNMRPYSFMEVIEQCAVAVYQENDS